MRRRRSVERYSPGDEASAESSSAAPPKKKVEIDEERAPEDESDETLGETEGKAAADGQETKTLDVEDNSEAGDEAATKVITTLDAAWDTPAFPVFCLCKPPKEVRCRQAHCCIVPFI